MGTNRGSLIGMILLAGAALACSWSVSGAEWVWQEKSPAAPLATAYNNAAISSDGKTIFVGGYSTNLFVSKDAGASWSNSFPPGGNWTSVSCSGDAKAVIGTFLPGDVMLSVDGGATWVDDIPADTGGNFNSSAISTDSSRLYVGHNKGDVFQKIGVAAPWVKLTLPKTEAVATTVLQCSADGKTVLAGRYGGSLMLSADAGATWKVVDLTKGQVANWNSGWVSADGKTILAAAATGALNASFDGGAKWLTFFSDLKDLAIYGLGGAADASILVATTNQGVYLGKPATAGKTDYVWTKQTAPGTTQFKVACSKTAKMIFLGCAMDGVPYMSRNSGTSWSKMDLGNYWFDSAASSDGACQLLAGASHLMYSKDKGGTWADVAPAKDMQWQICGISADGKKLAAGMAYGGFSVSADAGATWVGCPAVGEYEGWGGTVMTPKADVLLACGRPSFIYKSKDFGVTWETLYPVDKETALYWNGIAVDSTGAKILAAAFEYGVFQSLDGGATWKMLDVTPDVEDIQWTNACSSADGMVLAVTALGGNLYVSKDGGATWTASSPTGKIGDWYGVSCSADGKVIAATTMNAKKFYLSMDTGATWKEQTPASSTAVKWTQPFVSSNGRWTGGGSFGGKSYLAELVDAPLDIAIVMKGKGSMYPTLGQRWLKSGQKIVLSAFAPDSGIVFAGWGATSGLLIKEIEFGRYELTAYDDGQAAALFAKGASTFSKLSVDAANKSVSRDYARLTGTLSVPAGFDPSAGQTVSVWVDGREFVCDQVNGTWQKFGIKGTSFVYNSNSAPEDKVKLVINVTAKTWNFTADHGTLWPFITPADGVTAAIDMNGTIYGATVAVTDTTIWRYPEGIVAPPVSGFNVASLRGARISKVTSGDNLTIPEAMMGTLTAPTAGDVILTVNGFSLVAPLAKFEYLSNGGMIYDSQRDPDFTGKSQMKLTLHPASGTWSFSMFHGDASKIVRNFGVLKVGLTINGVSLAQTLDVLQTTQLIKK